MVGLSGKSYVFRRMKRRGRERKKEKKIECVTRYEIFVSRLSKA